MPIRGLQKKEMQRKKIGLKHGETKDGKGCKRET